MCGRSGEKLKQSTTLLAFIGALSVHGSDGIVSMGNEDDVVGLMVVVWAMLVKLKMAATRNRNNIKQRENPVMYCRP